MDVTDGREANPSKLKRSSLCCCQAEGRWAGNRRSAHRRGGESRPASFYFFMVLFFFKQQDFRAKESPLLPPLNYTLHLRDLESPID